MINSHYSRRQRRVQRWEHGCKDGRSMHVSDNNTVNTIVELHVRLIYYTGIPASLYSHSHTIDSTISHQPIATIWGSPRSFYHHVGDSASMIPRSGAAAADWWIWPIRL